MGMSSDGLHWTVAPGFVSEAGTERTVFARAALSHPHPMSERECDEGKVVVQVPMGRAG